MKLWIIRHADAEPTSSSDFERRLTPKGIKQAKKLGGFLELMGVNGPLFSSPYFRAHQTAEIIHSHIKSPHGVIEDKTLGCGMAPDEIGPLVTAAADAEHMLIVGHEPDLSRLICWLIGSDNGIVMKKCSCALLMLDAPAFAGAEMIALMPPKMIPES